MKDPIVEFIEIFKESFDQGTFVKLTLGKSKSKNAELKNIYIRPILLKKKTLLSFTYRYQSRDEVKNYAIKESLEIINELLGKAFMRLHLFTTQRDYELSINKKGKGYLRDASPNFTKLVIETHDHQKKRFVDASSLYLNRLEITDAESMVRPSRQDKFRQIHKYIEILEPLIDHLAAKKSLRIYDMGSGKGYLTFALYDYLKNIKKYKCQIKGIELRDHLVKFCNELAEESKFNELHFEKGSILDYPVVNADVLIALHACDTATDESIYTGIKSEASLIICSPCCHKQIRKSMHPDLGMHPALKHGILLERQAEIITDTIRSLILEKHAYDTKIFEFISSEHTSKNLMITAVKSKKKVDSIKIQSRIDLLKEQYNIDYHHLERLLCGGELKNLKP